MVIYEATTKDQFQKIIDFLIKQQDTLLFKCWARRFEQLQPEYFIFLKEQLPQLVFLVLEDVKGEIKAVLSFELRGPPFSDKEPKILSRLNFVVDKKTPKKYRKEIVDFVVRKYIKLGYHGAEFYMAAPAFEYTKGRWGEDVKILREIDDPEFGKVYFVRIDASKLSEVL